MSAKSHMNSASGTLHCAPRLCTCWSASPVCKTTLRRQTLPLLGHVVRLSCAEQQACLLQKCRTASSSPALHAGHEKSHRYPDSAGGRRRGHPCRASRVAAAPHAALDPDGHQRPLAFEPPQLSELPTRQLARKDPALAPRGGSTYQRSASEQLQTKSCPTMQTD